MNSVTLCGESLSLNLNIMMWKYISFQNKRSWIILKRELFKRNMCKVICQMYKRLHEKGNFEEKKLYLN